MNKRRFLYFNCRVFYFLFFDSYIPLTTWPISDVPVSCAKWPKMPNIVKPANKLVNVSSVVTIVASRYTLCSNRLNDAYIIKLPKHTASEKKHCVIAAYQTYVDTNKAFASLEYSFIEKAPNIWLVCRVCSQTYIWIDQFAPLWSNEKYDAIQCTRQCYSTEQQHKQNDVWKQRWKNQIHFDIIVLLTLL